MPVHSARIVPEIFEQMIRQRAFDVSELGMTYFLRAMEVNPEFLAIPVFPNRAFRHSAIYINKASRIQCPEDLAGKTIGELALYGHDAGVMPKGMLSDDYGVTHQPVPLDRRRDRLPHEADRLRAAAASRRCRGELDRPG